MKKALCDLTVVENRQLGPRFCMLTFRGALPAEILPGQFAQVRIDASKPTFLRRPISICDADPAAGTLRLLVRRAGSGTEALCAVREGDVVNMLLPLGRSFSIPENKDARILLAGGGVGVAPMLFYGKQLKALGYSPEFLTGARSEAELLLRDEFEALGPVHVSTDDGSAGHRGLVTLNPALDHRWDLVACCGPKPMMVGVAKKALESGSPCEVSLENMMACGLGACLCCVEKTVRGNVCVCTEGPVFNIDELTWFD